MFGHRCTALYAPCFRESLDLPEHFRIYQEDNYIAMDCGCAYQNKLSRLGGIRRQDGAKFYVANFHRLDDMIIFKKGDGSIYS